MRFNKPDESGSYVLLDCRVVRKSELLAMTLWGVMMLFVACPFMGGLNSR
jgi:hypothetical protein